MRTRRPFVIQSSAVDFDWHEPITPHPARRSGRLELGDRTAAGMQQRILPVEMGGGFAVLFAAPANSLSDVASRLS
jgi:hypothetical protein